MIHRTELRRGGASEFLEKKSGYTGFECDVGIRKSFTVQRRERMGRREGEERGEEEERTQERKEQRRGEGRKGRGGGGERNKEKKDEVFLKIPFAA